MSKAARARTGQVSLRVAGLWICLLLFLLRVIAQIEVLLVAPQWLPPMEAWYSGLLPYPLLLPLQILLLMVMTVFVARETQLVLAHRRNARPWHRVLRYFGYVYFLAMFLRLAFQSWRGAQDLVAAGAIPVVFHWVLALFVVLLARKDAPTLTAYEAIRAAPSTSATPLQFRQVPRPGRALTTDRARRSGEKSRPH
jgi:hypothetical protein